MDWIAFEEATICILRNRKETDRFGNGTTSGVFRKSFALFQSNRREVSAVSESQRSEELVRIEVLAFKKG